MFPENILVQLYDSNCNPVKGDIYAAGYDLTVSSVNDFSGDTEDTDQWYIKPGQTVAIDCGLRLGLPKNVYARIVPRSSWRKRGLICDAIIDPGFLDHVLPFVTNASNGTVLIQKHTKVLQCIFMPLLEWTLIPVKNLMKYSHLYNRGGGVGSTGD